MPSPSALNSLLPTEGKEGGKEGGWEGGREGGRKGKVCCRLKSEDISLKLKLYLRKASKVSD